MQFNSYSYLLLLAIVVPIFWLVPPGRWRRVYVLVLSILFYATWSLALLWLPLAISLVTFCAARIMVRRPEEARKQPMIAAIAAILALLAFFKYPGFLLANFSGLGGLIGWEPHLPEWLAMILLPLGISFYSFEAISYLLDVRQGRVKEIKFFELLLFIMFWPHLIAGPIVRARELIPQFKFQKQFDYRFVVSGMDRLVWGLVQKNVFANNLGSFVDAGFVPTMARANTTVDNWALAVAFGLQIYFDFAAYCNMAIGAARLIGVSLPENFNHPYLARNPSDFWSRWHMTLTRWIRDYLFFPVNARYQGSPLPLYASLLGIMALVGLWHGAAWGFVVWGLIHGAMLVLQRMSEGIEKSWPRISSVLLRVLTPIGVMAAWVPFRAHSLTQASTMLKSMFVHFSFGVSYSINFYLITFAIVLFVAAEPWLDKLFSTVGEHSGSKIPWRLVTTRAAAYACALLLFLIFDDRNTAFIYFQF